MFLLMPNRVIAMNASRAQTGMTSEALGVSVAPSFFQSCVADGKTARMEDVIRFKVMPPFLSPSLTHSISLCFCHLYSISLPLVFTNTNLVFVV